MGEPLMFYDVNEKSFEVFDIDDRVIKLSEEVGELLKATSDFRHDSSMGSAERCWVEICDVRMALDQLEHRLTKFGLSKQTKSYIRGKQMNKLTKALDERWAEIRQTQKKWEGYGTTKDLDILL